MGMVPALLRLQVRIALSLASHSLIPHPRYFSLPALHQLPQLLLAELCLKSPCPLRRYFGTGGAPSPPQPRGGTSLSPRHATGCGSGSRAADNSAKTVKATEDDGVNIAVTLLTLLASVPATVPKMEPTPSVDHNCSLGGDAPREQPTKPVSDHPLVSGLPLGHDAYDHRHHLYGRHSEKALTHPHPHCYDRSGVLEHHHSSWSDPSVHHHHHRHAQTHAHHAHPQPRVHLNPYQQTSHGFQAQPYHPEWSDPHQYGRGYPSEMHSAGYHGRYGDVDAPVSDGDVSGDPHAHAVASDGGQRRQASSSGATGRWTSAEHSAFLRGLECHGRKWARIAEMVGSRTPDQVRSHAQKYFIKSRKATAGDEGANSLDEQENGSEREQDEAKPTSPADTERTEGKPSEDE
mmetsp:Transcript_42596/g.113955  ORF Transcript_42596/g.113955 Transcript_42596/m.113955 type:complete len:404 (+) Transcript_42596:255-1466(+)